MSAPIQPEQPSALDLAWNTITAGIHKAAADGVRIPHAVLDAKVNQLTNGAIPSYDELVSTKMQHDTQRERLAQQSDQPGAIPTAIQSFGTGATFGLLPKIVGAVSPDTRSEMESYAQQGEAAHPWASALGDFAGGAAGGTVLGAGLGGKAAFGLRSPLAGPLQSLHPVVRGMLAGSATGGIAGGMSTAAETPDALNHLGTVAGGIGIGGALGAILGGSAEHLAAKVNAAPDLLWRAVSESAPIGPGRTGGAGFGAGIETLKAAEAAQGNLPDALQKPVALMSPPLKLLAAKQLPLLSPTAKEAAVGEMNRMIDAATTAKNAITNHPTEGYNAILGSGDAIVAANPDAVAVMRSQKGWPPNKVPTARELADFYQEQRDRAMTLKSSKDLGHPVSGADIREAGGLAQRAGQVLADIPGFSDLQAKTAPYLQQLSDLRALRKIATSYPRRGATEPLPSGGLEEGLTAGLGMSKYVRGARTARSLVAPLYGTNSVAGLENSLEALEPRWPGLFPGLLVGGAERAKARIMRGLLAPEPSTGGLLGDSQ